MNKQVCNFYIQLVLGYVIYDAILFKICSSAWGFVICAVIFNRIWTNYLTNYFLSQVEEDIKRIEDTIKKAFKEAHEEYKKKKKD